jgi:hypothetical protein
LAKKAFVYDGSQWVDIAQSTADLTNYANMTTTPISGFRNIVLNGGFNVWQRGNGAFTTTGFSADRWNLFYSPGTGFTRSVTREAESIPGLGYTNYLRLTTSAVGSGNESNIFQQKIESVYTLNQKTVTLSMYVKNGSATPQPVFMELRQNFGGGGSSTVYVGATPLQTVTQAEGWVRHTGTLTLPSVSGKAINTGNDHLDLWIQVPSNGVSGQNISIAGVQIEEGTIATPFEQRPISAELLMCQRYYYRITAGNTYGYFASGVTHTTTNGVMIVNFPVKLRDIPAFAVSSVSHFGLISPLFSTLSTIAISSDGQNTNNGAVAFTGSFTAGHGVIVRANNNANAWMEFSAELY